jgi:hypothetical protein
MSDAEVSSICGEIGDEAARKLVGDLMAGVRRIRVPLAPGWQVLPDPLPIEMLQPDALHTLAVSALELMPEDEIRAYLANRRQASGHLTIVREDDEPGLTP